MKGKLTGSIVIKQKYNREKTKVRFFVGTKARSKGFDPKKSEVLTLLPLTCLCREPHYDTVQYIINRYA